MNFIAVLRQLGLLLLVMSGAVLGVAGWSAIQCAMGDATEKAAMGALTVTVAAGGILGMALWLGTSGGARSVIGRREAILLVATSWFLAAGIGALPFRLWAVWGAPIGHEFAGTANCYFESMSGLTTTGATVLSDVESLPRSLLLWRAVTHWLGGLGIVVLFVAVLPMLGVGGKHIFRMEKSGLTPEGVRPRIQETARLLLVIYLSLTVAEILALCLAGMNLFDATCHTFATLSTGGFGTRNASVGAYDSAAVELIIIVFMVASGINFGLYYQFIRQGWKPVWQDSELRCYLGLILVASLIIGMLIHGGMITITSGAQVPANLSNAARHGLFQVVTMQTNTGFCTADFDRWSFSAKAILVVLMFVGGSAGSTSGGIKVIRFVVTAKILWAELEHVFRPNAVRVVRIGKAALDTETKITVLIYPLSVIILTMLVGGLLMILEQGRGIDVTTAFTASVATFTNTGPGLGRVGAVSNFGWFGDASKWLMSLLMALGRLEVFTIVVLLSPRFWRSD